MSSAKGCTPVIIVHGGASSSIEGKTSRHPGIEEAARKGYQALLEGSAVDAVERAVCCLEDNPLFNAGCGSKLNAAGEIEMEALIMEGKSLKSGAVSCVRDVKNPVKVARCIMEKSEHNFLVGKGLEAFIDEMGFPRINPKELVTEKRKEELQTLQKSGSTSVVLSAKKDGEHGTVGAVALDKNGNIACATSTGGITGTNPGRVGDSPLIGSGGYCDNAIGGVSTTGKGEATMTVTLAARVILYMEQGLSCQAASLKALDFLKQRTSYEVGLIVVSASGDAQPVFTCPAMSWARVKDGQLSHGALQGEMFDGGKV